MNFKSPSTNVATFRNVSAALIAHAGLRHRLIDVREPEEFYGALGRIPNAELVPLGTLEAASRAWPKDERLMLVCRPGARSARAAGLLVQLGFRDVDNVEGGTQAYVEAGLPVERG